MELKDVIKDTAYRLIQGGVHRPCAGLSHDSRAIQKDWLFVARAGLKENGASYAHDAVQRGATAVAGRDTERDLRSLPSTITVLDVDDVRAFLALGSAALNGHPSQAIKLMGVTGTNGKTSICHLAQGVLNQVGRRTGCLGTIGYDTGSTTYPSLLTTPEAPTLHALMAEMVKHNCEAVTMEVSSHALDQGRVIGLSFDAGVFTNLAQDHLDYHQTQEAYLRAKAGLFEQVKPSGVAVLPSQSPHLAFLRERCPAGTRVLTYGTNPEADLEATNLRMELGRSTFDCKTPWGNAEVALNLVGRFNIMNALAAMGVLGNLEVLLEEMVDALGRLAPIPGRMEEVAGEGPFRVFIDYAHTEDALAQALSAIREAGPREILVVFGCGGDRDRGKRPAMGRVAAEGADHVFVTSDNARSESPERIMDDILSGIDREKGVYQEPNRKKATAMALQQAQPGDVVLIAGKGHETYEERDGKRVPYSDHAVVAELLATVGIQHG